MAVSAASVAAALIHRAIGRQLTCVFVDHGLLRLGEREQVESLVRDKMGGAYPLDVPLEVSVGYGRSWDTAAH